MCNDYGAYLEQQRVVQLFQGHGLPIKAARSNFEGREDIKPTDHAPVVFKSDDGLVLEEVRWGFPRDKGGPQINTRSEGRHFDKGRCLILASHFFEFTGDKYPKTKWKFTKKDEDWFCIAGVWRMATINGVKEARFSMITCEPSKDILPYHDRQVAIIEPENYNKWLNDPVKADSLLHPLPEGSLNVQQVR